MQRRILVCPLDWGLGHATRCIPVINALLRRGCVVHIAGSGPSLTLLRLEFPALTFHEIQSYNIKYPGNWPLGVYLGSRVPELLQTVKKEHHQVNEIIQQHQIELVISDNRYGCYSHQVKSVIITHQLSLRMPSMLRWTKRLADSFHHRLIKRFNECWVPDLPDHTYSGDLSDTKKLNAKFIGPLSRMTFASMTGVQYQLTVLLSGPEPQRTLFEQLIIKQLAHTSVRCAIVRGLPGNAAPTKPNVYNYLGATDLNDLLNQSEVVVCRSGYSSLMDLAVLRKKAIFVPTPGQSEQEYLADRLAKRKMVVAMKQSSFNLQRALDLVHQTSGLEMAAGEKDYLNSVLEDFLK